jgi:hypothetical protein
METKWQIGPVKLANGEEAFVDAINEGQEAWRYTGRIKSHARWISTGWDDTGRRMYSELNHAFNLAPPPKKTVRVQACILVYEDGSTISTSSDESDLSEAKKHAFALVKFDREVTEGEGL